MGNSLKQINGEEIKLKTEAIKRHKASNIKKSKGKSLENFGERSLMIERCKMNARMKIVHANAYISELIRISPSTLELSKLMKYYELQAQVLFISTYILPDTSESKI